MTTPTILALTPEQLEISPGVGAFTTFFVLAIAIVLLVFNMSKHLRKVDRYRIEEEMRAEFSAESASDPVAEGERPAAEGTGRGMSGEAPEQTEAGQNEAGQSGPGQG